MTGQTFTLMRQGRSPFRQHWRRDGGCKAGRARNFPHSLAVPLQAALRRPRTAFGTSG